ncbi:hypothetical protein D3C87_1643680 [compost metagenome]
MRQCRRYQQLILANHARKSRRHAFARLDNGDVIRQGDICAQSCSRNHARVHASRISTFQPRLVQGEGFRRYQRTLFLDKIE